MIARSLRLGLLIVLLSSMMPSFAAGTSINQRQDAAPSSYDEMLALAIGADGEPGTIDQFWRELFSHLAGSPEYESPRQFVAYDADHRPESDCVTSRTRPESLLNNAFYCPADGVLAWDNAWLKRMADGRGLDSAPVAIIAHEWGHHIQALLGSKGTGLGAELQADCYASLYLDDAMRKDYFSLEDYGKTLFSLFAMGNLVYSNSTWFNPTEHGTPSMRMLAMLAGDGVSIVNSLRATGHDHWTAALGYCDDFAAYAPSPAVFVGPYAINPLPNSTTQVHEDGSVDLVHPTASMHIAFHEKPDTGTAAESFDAARNAYFALDPASETHMIGAPSFMPLVGGRDGGLQEYVKIETQAGTAITTHGYFGLDVLPGVGSIVLDVSSEGPPSGNGDEWLDLAAHLMVVSAMICSPSGMDIGACSFSQLSWMGLPELTIRATSDGVLPDKWVVDAGPTLISLLDEATAGYSLYGGSAPNAPAYMLVKLSDALHLPPAGPLAEPPGSRREATPDWFYSATIIGMPAMLDITEQSQLVVDLTPGEWVVVGGPFMAPVSPPFTVVESSTTTAPVASFAATEVVLGDQGISGLERVAPGHQIWRIRNAGSQPHELLMYRFPDGTTREQVDAVNQYYFAAPGTEPPPGLGFDPDADVVLVSPMLPALSSGQSALVEISNLPPGIYAIYCYVPAKESATVHAAEGEITVFTVGKTSSNEQRPKL